jgi:hypothetical protein
MLASSRLRRCRIAILPVMVFLLFCLLLGSAPVQGGGTPKSKYQNYLSQLKTRFQTWDLNADTSLDKAELAKGFRGPSAKPYDYLAPGGNTDDDPLASKAKKGKVRTLAVALVCLPEQGLAINLALAEMTSKPEPAKAVGLDPSFKQYGDYQFLMLIGKNDKIAKLDYDNWSMTYAKNLDKLQELQKEIKTSQSKLSKAKSPSAKQAANAELSKHQADLASVNAQLNAISPAIQSGLNV